MATVVPASGQVIGRDHAAPRSCSACRGGAYAVRVVMMRFLGAGGMAMVPRQRWFSQARSIGTRLFVHGVPDIAARFRAIGDGGA